MSRNHVVLAALAFLASVLLPAAASANKSYSYGYDTDRDRFGWAIVSEGNSTTTDLDSQQVLDRLKEEYDGDFLFFRDGDDTYVIRDRAMIERAQRAAKPVNDAGRELGEAVSVQVREALGNSKDARERARLARSIGRLSREIARAERRGDDTEDLERDLDRLQRQLDDLEESTGAEKMTVKEKTKIKMRSEEASRNLKQATQRLQNEMREILSDAKARRLAEPVR